MYFPLPLRRDKLCVLQRYEKEALSALNITALSMEGWVYPVQVEESKIRRVGQSTHPLIHFTFLSFTLTSHYPHCPSDHHLLITTSASLVHLVIPLRIQRFCDNHIPFCASSPYRGSDFQQESFNLPRSLAFSLTICSARFFSTSLLSASILPRQASLLCYKLDATKGSVTSWSTRWKQEFWRLVSKL